MNASPKHFYEFGPFRLDAVKRLLLRDGEPVALKSKCFETLLVLVEARGRVMEKDELMRRIWPDSIVEESNLTVYISALRRALDESPQDHRYIVTVPGRGYRFVAEVQEVREAGAELMAPEKTAASGTIEEGAEEPGEQESAKGESNRTFSPRSLITVAGVLLLGLAVAGYYWGRAETAKPEPAAHSIRSIAVLPFERLDAEVDEYLGLRIADVLIAKLVKLKQLSVRPPGAIFVYKDQQADPVAVGRQQKVDAVLQGRLRQAGARIRVTIQLVSVRDGALLWAEEFNEKLSDLFAVEEAIAQHVADALVLRLSAEERRQMAKRDTESQAAALHYIKGRYFWDKRNAEGLKKSLECFQQALDLDPTYARAWAGLADAYAFLGSAYFDGQPPSLDMPRAKAAALRALEIDQTLAEAHCALAFVAGWY
jgi:DNA-binding winged helix-turn-helix (wHTH) protein/TolB-like protein